MAHMPENSGPLELKKPKPKIHKNSAGLSGRKKASKGKSMVVRRSGRLQSLVLPSRNQEIPMVEEINLVESDKEDEPRVKECPLEPIPSEQSLEEKFDYLVQTVEELKSKAIKRHFSGESPSTNLNYKSLYIDSQKKVEALINENYELGKKLEIALGKLEVYENVKDVMEKFKDVIVISSLTKATEAVVSLSSQAVFGGFSSLDAAVDPGAAVVPQTSSVKRKKRGKESKKD